MVVVKNLNEVIYIKYYMYIMYINEEYVHRCI